MGGISRLIGKFYDVVTMLKMIGNERNERNESESGLDFKFSLQVEVMRTYVRFERV